MKASHESHERIRALNDELRRNLPNGHAVLTTGVVTLGPEAIARIVKTVAVYDDFCHANDPYGEHDFGSFKADGRTIFFKIDYYDKDLVHHSPDPADLSVTECIRATTMRRTLKSSESRRTKAKWLFSVAAEDSHDQPKEWPDLIVPQPVAYNRPVGNFSARRGVHLPLA